ncbi:hypothetical protein BRADI_2g17953v3 [Brachypodium distachyon]|uniref:Uncharacterized protein n=1 Tax=Brachypodium distachyon TaxID=15368 RepID=A0A2K2D946_BRADI|nr:hypothetical protein BRADI_2g17953v3 [Brachypodium distachyon]
MSGSSKQAPPAAMDPTPAASVDPTPPAQEAVTAAPLSKEEEKKKEPDIEDDVEFVPFPEDVANVESS